MEAVKQIMIGLDLSVMDKQLISYTAFLTHYFPVEKIYFVNVQEDLLVPDNLLEQFPEMNKPLDEEIRNHMKATVSAQFPNHQDYDIEYMVLDGPVKKELNRWVEIKKIDLLIIGHKVHSYSGGVLPQMITRMIKCSVLLVPENPPMHINSVLIPTDFSDYSAQSFLWASGLKEKDGDIDIVSQHIFVVPDLYYHTGKTEEEFAEIMRSYAEDRQKEFLHKWGQDPSKIRAIYCYNRDRKSPAHIIKKLTEDINTDLLIIGARGLGKIASMLLGSVTEKLLQTEYNVPILVIKDPKHRFTMKEVIDTL